MTSPSVKVKTLPAVVDAEVVVRTGPAGTRPRSSSSSSRRSSTPIYYVSKMTLHLAPDPEKGIVTVHETISYRHFQTVDRHSRSHVCLRGNMRLDSIQCLEDPHVQVLKQKREGDTFKIYFGFHATDQLRTFEIKYVIEDGISRDAMTFEDAMQLVCLDGKWDTTIRVFELQISLPKGVAVLEKVIKISEGGLSSLTEDRRGNNLFYFIRENIPERIPVVVKVSWIDHKTYRNLPAAQQQSILTHLSNRIDGSMPNHTSRFLQMSSRDSGASGDRHEPQPAHHSHQTQPKISAAPGKQSENSVDQPQETRRPSPALSPNNPNTVPPSALKRSPSAERVEYRPKSPQTSWRAHSPAQTNAPTREHWWVPRSRPSSASSVSSLGSQRSRTQGAPRTVTFVPNS